MYVFSEQRNTVVPSAFFICNNNVCKAPFSSLHICIGCCIISVLYWMMYFGTVLTLSNLF